MKICSALLLAISATLATACDPTICKLPSCRCFSSSIPGNLDKKQIPQMVFLTFENAITVTNNKNYTEILKNRVNPNGCPITMTFFVTHDYNDYELTHNLYYKGNEIAAKSISLSEQDYWKHADKETWKQQVDGLRQIASAFANIPISDIKGFRAPFLQSSGDATMSVLKELNMLYDTSFSSQSMSPPVWPYTLDYGFQQECAVPPCPESWFPGLWVSPMVTLKDKNDSVCALADACARPSDRAETFEFLKSNFLRHYEDNRAPFGVYLHPGWFQDMGYALDGYIEFLDYLAKLDDVYIVSVSKGLEWVRNPVPLSQLSNFAPFKCPTVVPSRCVARNCYYYESDAGGERILRSCVTCPDVYPWIGNPLGIA